MELRNAIIVSCKIPIPINLSPYFQLFYVENNPLALTRDSEWQPTLIWQNNVVGGLFAKKEVAIKSLWQFIV